MPTMTGARLLAETMHGYGLTHVFYMPFIAPRALAEMQTLGITLVQTHSEKAAAYMADGYARTRRGPGLCMSQSVGALNLAAGLQDAYLANSPVIAITGREVHSYSGRNPYQEVDHINPFLAVAKSSAYMARPQQLSQLLRNAVRTAVSGAPGPAHLDVEGRTGGSLNESVDGLEARVDDLFRHFPPFRPVADDDSMAAALTLLKDAERPIIVAGGGVTSSDARDELIAFAEKLAIPVATALNAKAMFPPNHPLAAGTPGSYSRASANQLVCEADLVFFIGSRTGSQVTNYYQVPQPNTRIIQLDIDAVEIGRNYPAKVGLHGDVKATLKAMLRQAKSHDGRKAWLGRVRELIDAWNADNEKLFTSKVLPMRPERLCREIESNLPDNAILVSDTGHAGIWTGAYLDLKSSDHMYLRCAGSLGWGFPASLGAKCAMPDRPVVCFTGDGGFWYHLTELDTARKYGINTVTVVNNNHSLNQEKTHNEASVRGVTDNADQFWLFPEMDFAALAQSMGCIGTVVKNPDDFATAFQEALTATRPVVLDVRTNIDGIAPSGWSPER